MNSRRNLIALLFLSTVSLVTAFSEAAFAHGLDLQVTYGGDRLRIHGSYSDGVNAPQAKVTIHYVDASENRPAVQGRLDADGVFFLPLSEAYDLRIVLEDGSGHRVEVFVPRSRLQKLLGTGADRVEVASTRATSTSMWWRILAGVGSVLVLAVVLKAVFGRDRSNRQGSEHAP